MGKYANLDTVSRCSMHVFLACERRGSCPDPRETWQNFLVDTFGHGMICKCHLERHLTEVC